MNLFIKFSYKIVIKYWRYVLDRFTRSLSTIGTYGGRIKLGALTLSAGLVVALVVEASVVDSKQTPSTTASARATQLQDGAKLHARQVVQDRTEFTCLRQILYKESRWNPYARNGSHYGIGQMRSKWYGTLGANAQIDESVRYILKRYNTICRAWEFHQRKGYY